MSVIAESTEQNPDALTWDRFRLAACHAAQERGEWAGSPMLAENIPLVLEPRYPYQGLNGKCLSTLSEEESVEKEEDDGWVIANSWWNDKRCATIYLCHNLKTGKVAHCWAQDNGYPHRWRGMLDAMDAARYMDHVAESRALRTLEQLLGKQAFAFYFLLGYFLETSKASGITYLFRKLRPTIAMTPRPGPNMRILTSLCLHPIGYYEGTHLGAMVPTDDVIAHLLMCRGDEWKFWSKANHHPPHTWQAGI